MSVTKKRILIIAVVLSACLFTVGGWASITIFAWVSDLPNRVVVDGDAIANAFGHAGIEAYHHALREGDSTVRVQILEEQFAALIDENSDGAGWVQSEFGEELKSLVKSDDARVASAAAEVLSKLEAVSLQATGGE
ncbi:hypothetical protein LOC67_17240 [Stieleria sp. JC731]|uniref:hypothetical protein n=1 Tax=Pirellulaceae TaxID=2691357 RepID=UPI001E626A38|nr:hypothetical protein [Stieleria sp. JC731]MCC9602302.1 hypothetical protein [Stieleria sp. JC731]